LNLFPNDSQSPHLRDLHDVWSGHEALHLRYDATAKARCGLERTIRVERLLIANNRRHENGVLNKATLGLTLNLERLVAARLASSTNSLPCVQTQNGNCLFTSPLSFWDHDERILTGDDDVISTLNHAKNISLFGFPTTLAMVVADRASLEREEDVDTATFLVLTYYFRDDNCHSQSGHLTWVQLMTDIMQGMGHIDATIAQPRLLAIQVNMYFHDSNFRKLNVQQFDADQSTLSVISVLLYVTYLVVFIHFSGSMRRMNTVHSRFGIAFTGIVEIIVSTVTSVSVCAIWGFRVTMVPW
jgi:Sterol-sensing domain of SREBP cleavage-activation